MHLIRRLLLIVFDMAERALGYVFPARWNPLLNLGALGFLFYWVVTVSGIYVYIFFDTGVHDAYDSIEYMTHDQWYAAGIMRSLHRYASDGLVVAMLLHLTREFALDRYRGVRWFSWVTGVPVFVMVFMAGITGYWLVWDTLAQYVAIVSTEWFDKLGVFGESIAGNFLHPGTLDDRFFTLMIFMHIAIPLIALIVLWVHLQRVTKPRINPPRGLAVGTMLSMLVMSLAFPALSQGPADLARVQSSVGLDWFYLPLYPLLDQWPGSVTWSAAGALLVILIAVPWLPPLRRLPVAHVDLENCNGCVRCYNDCPYNAITMAPRTDGTPFEREPIVNPSLCTSCGICAGACPTSMPFRHASALVAGIDLPDRNMAALREDVQSVGTSLSGDGRVMVFCCEHTACLEPPSHGAVGTVALRCVGQLPPAFIDYVLSRGLADGVLISGCSENACFYRFGADWTEARVKRQRDPELRARVPAERLRLISPGRLGTSVLRAEVARFSADVAKLPATVRERASTIEMPGKAEHV
jgi:ferredoxin/coenzyme F420-reducing hydrogenase delta subunit